MDIQTWLDDYDHIEAVRAIEGEYPATWKISEMAELLWFEDGEADGADWQMFWRAQDGGFWFTTAWCDYTGWDCRSGGEAHRFATEAEARAKFRIG